MNLTNTQTRIISALVLLAVFVSCILIGVSAVKVLIGVIGLLIIDELHVQFFQVKRLGLIHITSNIIFIAGFVFFCLYV